MVKILNLTLRNTLAHLSHESVQFDEQGVGEVQSEELYKELLQLTNFFPVAEGTEKSEAPAEEAKEEPKEEVKETPEPAEEAKEEPKEEVKKAPAAKKPTSKK